MKARGGARHKRARHDSSPPLSTPAQSSFAQHRGLCQRVFGFLTLLDLLAAPIVCRGWCAALAHATLDMERVFERECDAHQIRIQPNPFRLVEPKGRARLRHAFAAGVANLRGHIARCPARDNGACLPCCGCRAAIVQAPEAALELVRAMALGGFVCAACRDRVERFGLLPSSAVRTVYRLTLRSLAQRGVRSFRPDEHEVTDVGALRGKAYYRVCDV
jgi:hypothetical protein